MQHNLGQIGRSSRSVLANPTDELVFTMAENEVPVILDSLLANWKSPVSWRTITTENKIDAMRNDFLQRYDDAGRRKLYRIVVVSLLKSLKRLKEVMSNRLEADGFHMDFTMICVLRELLFSKPLPKCDLTNCMTVHEN